MVPRYLNSNQVAQADEQVSYLRKKCHSKMGDGGVTGKAMLWKLETHCYSYQRWQLAHVAAPLPHQEGRGKGTGTW